MLIKIFHKFVTHLFPSFCVLCKSPLSEEEVLFCNSCFSHLPLAKSYCKRCGTLLSETLLNYFHPENLNFCSLCERERLPYERVYIGFLYKEPLKTLILKAKFAQDFSLAYQLGKLLKMVLPLNLKEYDLCIPIPLSLQRERERGFNQSLILLWGYKGFMRGSNKLVRIRDTQPQSKLDQKGRFENVKNAFISLDNLEGKKILLLDDIMTTGATLKEAAKALKKAGAKEVHLLVLARA